MIFWEKLIPFGVFFSKTISILDCFDSIFRFWICILKNWYWERFRSFGMEVFLLTRSLKFCIYSFSIFFKVITMKIKLLRPYRKRISPAIQIILFNMIDPSLLAFCSFLSLYYRDRSNQQTTCWIPRQDHNRLPAADDSVHRQVDRGEREGLEADSEARLRGVHEARSPGQGEEWGRPRKGRYYTGLCVCLFVWGIKYLSRIAHSYETRTFKCVMEEWDMVEIKYVPKDCNEA